MPVTALALSKVKRSPSLHSEQSSSLSESRHVSFNQDVSVKRIPKKTVRSTRSLTLNNPSDEFSAKCEEFVNVPPPSDQEQIAVEAEQIIKQLQDIECSVSPTFQPTTQAKAGRIKTPSPAGSRFFASRVLTPTLFGGGGGGGSRASTLERKPLLGGRLSKSSSDLLHPNYRAMRVEGHSEQEDCPSPADNRLYGLQALSKLDNAVNGKVNNLYRDSSGSTDYSPPPKKNNYTPPKPPRKAPSTSPPNIRKGYASLDELDFVERPDGNIIGSSSSRYEPEDHITYSVMEPAIPFPNSYTSTNPALNHLRSSPTRYSPAASRQSPSRGNHTDSELLSSPSQVLYATISADKHKNSNLKNQHTVHSSSQTVQSGFRPVSVDRQMKSRTLSKENILDEPPYRYNNGAPSTSSSNHHHPHHASRSLERFIDSDKENRRQELKARIHVTSPHRFTPERQHQTGTRKPYKTTINTANDTIQYRGFSQENLDPRDGRGKGRFGGHGGGKRGDTEHYKVPKNKAPVPPEVLAHRTRRSEADMSSSAHHGIYGTSSRQNQFASTSLVRTATTDRGGQKGIGGEYDREGRQIRSERSGERSRAYSGYSTSPDREMSPDRYKTTSGRSVGSKSYVMERSPSSSPTRPPRTRAASSGEIHVPIRREHSGRRVERTPSTRAAATSRSPIKKIQRVHNEIQSDRMDRDQARSHRDPQTYRTSRDATGSRSHRDHQGSKTLTLSRDRGDKSGARGTKSVMMSKKEQQAQGGHAEDRLSKFTEYRGSERDEAEGSVRGGGRRSSHSVGERMSEVRRDSDYERERGHSVPPGANIESMRDFYKTSQYRSMYHLPPSPTRPAPVLDRSSKTQTLERSLRRELTGDSLQPPSRRQVKTSMSEGELTDDVSRQERVLRHRNKFINNNLTGEPGRKPVNNSDREPGKVHRGGEGRRQTGSREREKRPAPQPPTQRVRRSSADVLETSLSESESPRQEKAKSDVAGGWANGQSDVDADYRRSDVDTDYRREMLNSVHSEARGRDGGRREGTAPPSIYKQAASLNRREVEISQDDEEEEVVRSPTSLAREEERRKILELEEDRRRKGNNVSRSGSRVTKIIGLKSKSKMPDTENESQYSGHSSSSLKKDPASRTRLNNGARVKRNGSSATTASSRAGGVSRRKMPGSVTSSINSSESEHGSMPQSAGSRGTNTSGQSNRSVYLHATAVADIPTSSKKISAENAASTSNLKNSKKISRSISLLAPFNKNKQAKDKEVNYDSSGNQVPYSGKPPRPPPTRRASGHVQPGMTKDKKFASSSDLLRDEPEVLRSPVEEQKSSKVSRSVSMPKDTRLAGWFKKRKRV